MCDDFLEQCSCRKYSTSIILFIIMILEIIFSFTYVDYDFEDNPIFLEIDRNLNGKLIYSIAKKPLCNEDEEELVLGTWDGTKNGCFCNDVITEEKCSEELVNQGCNIIPGFNPINYTIINSNYLCVKKSSLSYRDLLKDSFNQIRPKNAGCPTYYKSCGKIDTLERILCVKNEETCPINDEIAEDNISNDFNQQDFFDSFDIGSNFSNENENRQILTIFKLSQKIPCINPVEKYWDYHYILEEENKRCLTEIKHKIYDDRYELLSNFTVNKYTLYYENSILGKFKYIDEVDLNKIKKDKVYLFGRNFIGFGRANAENYNYDILISRQNTSNTTNKVMFWAIVVAGGIIILILAVVLKINKIEISGFLSLECSNMDNIECSNLVLIIIFISLLLIFSIWGYVTSCIIIHNYTKIKFILNVEESDEYIYELIQNLFEKYYVNYAFSLSIIVICSILFLFLLCLSCSKLCDDDY